ncbi:C4-dicarboxylate transport system (C4-dicarboxylate-binding protein) [Fulvimarina pelagi HTCC2506]|uniref:C4-dicarboxylate transport system (C4-dicarboxylate-binding protein) n=2 Tax=Fulvimarina pelagi TaxID=217511 RepID=Q0FY47_9HYPH|nr:C4-dicarboxylate transport system (C4-dicarboxylate-binding protein) [Fulvimarina pelagi HTCC2506]
MAMPPAVAKTLKLAHVQPESHAFHKGAEAFKEALEEVSGGELEVDIFSNGVMGNERDLLEALQIGTVDVISVTSALTGTFNDDYQVFSLPFLFSSYEHAFAAMDSEDIRQKIEPDLINSGIRPIAYWIGGARSYYGLQPVETIEDLSGLKLRTMEAPYYVRAWEDLGAIPTPLPFGEVYMALQTNMVDGAEGGINTYVSKKFYEVAPNVAMLNYVYSVQLLHISETTWSGLSEEEKGWVAEAAKQSAKTERQFVLEEDASLEETLASHNVKVTHPEIGPFQDRVDEVYEMFRQEFGEETAELVDQIRNLNASQ